MYDGDDFDLAGFVVGAVERDQMIPVLDDMMAGDVLIGLASSWPHSNGYSLIRKIVDRSGLGWTDEAPFESGKSLGEALLTPTRIYVKPLLPQLKSRRIKGLAHITGGGLTENTPRMLPAHLKPEFDLSAWERPAVFNWLQEVGGVAEPEMQRTFNCGIGMVLCVDKSEAVKLMSDLIAAGEHPAIIGQLKPA